MKLACNRANKLVQTRFHGHVDVFILAPKLETAKLDLLANGVEAGYDLFGFLGGDDSAGAQHSRMRLARTNVFGIEAFVERNGGVDLLHDFSGFRIEAPAPHFIGHRVIA